MTIRFHLGGRLGNQLFQWAFAHVVSDRYGNEVLPVYDCFHNPNTSTSKDLLSDICEHWQEPKQKNLLGFILKILDKIGSKVPTYQLICFIFSINRTLTSYTLPTLPKKAPNVFTGFFINADVVRDNENTIFDELWNKIRRIELTLELPDLYQAVHVRRGDFADYADSYGLISPEFYERNIDRNLPIVLCTDSIEDSMDVIASIDPEIVLGPSESNAWQVLRIMAQAEHVVLSNSTLSWWGGFLAAKKGGRVIQPQPFYKEVSDYSNQLDFKLFQPQPAVFLE